MLKDYFEDKTIGFYLNLAAAGLTLITALLMLIAYGGSEMMAASSNIAWMVFVIPFAGVLIAVALGYFKLFNFAASVIALSNFVVILLFGRVVYNFFLLNSMGDIGFVNEFLFFCFGLLVVNALLSNVAAYWKQIKVEKQKEDVNMEVVYDN